MRKAIIIDDEPYALNGLVRFGPWKENGYEIAAVFTSAFEALKYCNDNAVDLVLTDIRMPGIDGLELMAALNHLENPPRLVVMSAYCEFEYAKEAIRLNAEAYLTKPVSMEELNNALEKISNKTNGCQPLPSLLEGGMDFAAHSDDETKQAGMPELESSYDDRLIRNLKSYIEANCSKAISLETIAEKFKMNPTYISAFFKRVTGVNYSDYLFLCRMEKAKQLLLNTRLSVRVISLSVGYHDDRYFSRLFQKQFGESPARYRRSSIK